MADLRQITLFTQTDTHTQKGTFGTKQDIQDIFGLTSLSKRTTWIDGLLYGMQMRHKQTSKS